MLVALQVFKKLQGVRKLVKIRKKNEVNDLEKKSCSCIILSHDAIQVFLGTFKKRKMLTQYGWHFISSKFLSLDANPALNLYVQLLFPIYSPPYLGTSNFLQMCSDRMASFHVFFM